MFTGKIVYLAAVTVNTRKAYVEPTNISATNEDDAKIKVRTKDAKTAGANVMALNLIMLFNAITLASTRLLN